MTRWGMVVDVNRCVGCQTCTIACKHANDTPPDVQWRRVLDVEYGAFPDVERLFLVVGCQHCANPPCVPVCPTRVIVIVRGYPEVDFKRGECTFCGACATACKAGALQNSECQIWPWAIKAQVANSCLPLRGVECRICGDHCQAGAIRFSPRLNGPPVAEIDTGACTGCGACVAPCPVSAISVA